MEGGICFACHREAAPTPQDEFLRSSEPPLGYERSKMPEVGIEPAYRLKVVQRRGESFLQVVGNVCQIH